jgi:hypothetical protein
MDVKARGVVEDRKERRKDDLLLTKYRRKSSRISTAQTNHQCYPVGPSLHLEKLIGGAVWVLVLYLRRLHRKNSRKNSRDD